MCTMLWSCFFEWPTKVATSQPQQQKPDRYLAQSAVDGSVRKPLYVKFIIDEKHWLGSRLMLVKKDGK